MYIFTYVFNFCFRYLCGIYVKKDVLGGLLALLYFRDNLVNLTGLGSFRRKCYLYDFFFISDLVLERTLTLSSFAFNTIFVYAQTKRLNNKCPYQLRSEFENKITSEATIGG